MDMSEYSKSVFGMFGGERENVCLEFANHLAGAVIDRFGRDTILVPHGEDHFTVTVSAVVSQHFFGWLFGFGTEVRIVSPESVRQKMQESLRQSLQNLADC